MFATMANLSLDLDDCIFKVSSFSIDTGDTLFQQQQLTAKVELSGHCVGVLVTLLLYVAALSERFEWTCIGGRPRWDFAGRVFPVSGLVLLNAASFLMSSGTGFRPWELNHTVCTVQGILFQFSYTAIILEGLAISITLYLVIVKMVSLEELQKGTYAAPLYSGVYGVAVLLAMIPYIVQLVTTKPLYHGGKLLGYCSLSFEGDCAAAKLFFYFFPGMLFAECLTCVLSQP